MHQNVITWRSAWRSNARGISGCATIAFSSDAKTNTFCRGGVVERFLSSPVARGEQATPWRIPYGECELAIEMGHAVGTVLDVGAQDYFGVGLSREPMATIDQRLSQLDVVVDFAVEGEPDRARLRAHRLGAAGQVNDAESGVSEASLVQRLHAVTVWAAVPEGTDHDVEDRRVRRPAVKIHISGDATHQRTRVTSVSESGLDGPGSS